jgi:photosystem II stability/assembly factor-like uncharacterized protein
MKSLVFILLVAAPLTAESLPWTTHGPWGGAVHALASAPSNPQTLYAASDAGVFRSSDGGVNWTLAGSITDPTHLAIDPTTESTVYVATESEVMKSTDGASTWRLLPLPRGVHISAVAIDPKRPETIYVGSSCPDPTYALQFGQQPGIIKSTDGGTTWTVSNQGLDPFGLCVDGLAVDPVETDRLYASATFGSERSDDGGLSWTKASGPVPGTAVVADLSDPSKRYGVSPMPPTFTNFLESIDSGRTWSDVMPRGILSGSVFRYDALTIDPHSGRLFLGASSGVYRSGDRGRSWIRLGGAARDRINGVVFDSATGALTIATSSGLFRSAVFPWNDWSPVNIELSTNSIHSLATDPKRPGTVYATAGDDISRLFVTKDFGASWAALPALPVADSQPAATITSLAIGADGAVYALVYIGPAPVKLYKLPSLTAEWSEIRIPFPGSITSVFADPITPGEYYTVGGSALVHTRDDGASWEVTAFSLLDGSTRSLAIDPRDPNVSYLATASSVMKSTDRGRTWVAKVTGLSRVGGIVISPADPSVLYLPTSLINSFQQTPLVARSTDAGESWIMLPAPASAPFANVEQMVPDRRERLTVYAISSKFALFRSTDGGTSWQSFADQLGGRGVTGLTIDSGGSVLHAGTFGRGVWELPLDSRRRAARKQ